MTEDTETEQNKIRPSKTKKAKKDNGNSEQEFDESLEWEGLNLL